MTEGGSELRGTTNVTWRYHEWCSVNTDEYFLNVSLAKLT